jgi:hypothetical protein
MCSLNEQATRRTRHVSAALIGLTSVAAHYPAFANDDAQRAREEMQRRLNEQVLSAPFNPGDVKRAEAYVEQARRQGILPAATPPSYWMPGWTCANVAAYAYYNYTDYRNCIYFNRYHGYYWR